MWELSRAVGFDYGLGRVTKPYSVEMRLLLSGGLDSPYLTVKAHSLNLILSILKYSEIPRRELIEGVRPLGSKFAQSRLEQSASVRESSIADLPTLVAHLSKRVVWTADVLAAEDFEGRYVQIEKTLNGLQERDTREQEYYALETVNYLADLGTDRARKIVSADLDKHGPAVKKVLTLGLKKVDLRLEQSKLDPDSQIALMTKSVLDSPQTYEQTTRFDRYEQEFVLWLLDRIAEVQVREATVFLRTLLYDIQYRGRIRYKAQELLVERGDLERHYQVLPPIPAD